MSTSTTPEIEFLEGSPASANRTAAPAVLTHRIEIVDIIRGVALLGILLMNIPGFALPDMFLETVLQDRQSPNFWVFAVNTIFFEGKMRALFSMIFGAGIILFTTGKERKGNSATGLFYRRMFWLTLFGLAHAHLLLWEGDILYFYGLIGMIAFLFRKVKPVYLAMGVPLVAVVGFAANAVFMQGIREARIDYREAVAASEAGQVLTEDQEAALSAWREIEIAFIPNPDDVAANTAAMRGDYGSVASHIRPRVWEWQTKYFLIQMWDMLALMLLGFALLRWGFLTMEWTRAQYIRTALVGYTVGLSAALVLFLHNLRNRPTVEASLAYLEVTPIDWPMLLYDLQRIATMMAHVAVVILIYQSGWLRRVMNGLKAVGQLAFTNYVMHTVICSLVFFGYGLNQFGTWQYYQLYYLVAGIWVLQMVVSPIWLKYYLFGPLEWLWRSLTYWRRQPFVRRPIEELTFELPPIAGRSGDEAAR